MKMQNVYTNIFIASPLQFQIPEIPVKKTDSRFTLDLLKTGHIFYIIIILISLCLSTSCIVLIWLTCMFKLILIYVIVLKKRKKSDSLVSVS